jgi:DNA-binding NarL/FixJ family response regulator
MRLLESGGPENPSTGAPFFLWRKTGARVVLREVPTASSNSVALGQQWPQELTRRESEVVLLVGIGMSNREIAQRLGLSVGTVKLHVHHIFRKTGARRRSNLVVQLATRGSAV